jgi:hypothetical protein
MVLYVFSEVQHVTMSSSVLQHLRHVHTVIIHTTTCSQRSSVTPWLSLALGLAYDCETVGISRFNRYRVVVWSGGASAVSVYRLSVTVSM